MLCHQNKQPWTKISVSYRLLQFTRKNLLVKPGLCQGLKVDKRKKLLYPLKKCLDLIRKGLILLKVFISQIKWNLYNLDLNWRSWKNSDLQNQLLSLRTDQDQFWRTKETQEGFLNFKLCNQMAKNRELLSDLSKATQGLFWTETIWFLVQELLEEY